VEDDVASIETRRSKDGKVTTYRVRWRIAGTNPAEWDGETFDGKAEAKEFKGLIDAYGQRRPPAEVLLARGFGDRIKGVALVAAASPEPADAQDAPAEPSAPMFLEYAEKVIDDLDHVLGYTKKLYRSMLKNHIAPVLGHLRIDEVGYDEVKAWQRRMTAKGLSRKTIANIRGSVIIPVLKAACMPQDNGRKPPLIQGNPVEGLKLPVGRKKRREVITSERDITLYLQCAYEVDPEAGDLLTVAITTGLRWGDLAGLRCRDIDLDEAEIRPTQVLAFGGEDHWRWELREYTKSIAGDERIIPIPPAIVELLRRRMANKKPNDLVFTSPTGRPLDHKRFREARYMPILELAQERGLARHITPHALRHSLLTMLADAGTDPKVMQHIAGHESMATLYNNYVRPTKDQRRKAAATVAQVVPMPFLAPAS
jgi:integrase